MLRCKKSLGAGALESFPESTFLVPCKALRDEGTSYHYAPPSRFMEISEGARAAIRETIPEHGMKYREVITWSTDSFYRETRDKVAYRKSEGCAVVGMECAAPAACAAFRGTIWGMILSQTAWPMWTNATGGAEAATHTNTP